MNISENLNRIIERFDKEHDIINDTQSLIDSLEKILTGLEPNLILLSDAYKYSHPDLYTPNLTKLVSYLESRGGKFDNTLFFGLQYILKKYLVGRVLSNEMVLEADIKLNYEDIGVFSGTKVFPTEKWLKLIDVHNGHFPVRIKAVPEGEVVPVKNVLITIESTDDEFPWLVGFLETLLLQVWYPITVATLSFEVKKIIKKNLLETGCDEKYIDITTEFILNDFGFRGVSSVESASIGGSAHLVNFMGSDNTIASDMIMKYYGGEIMYGKSIKASEHSVCCMEDEEGEINVFKRILTNNPTGIVACVSDSYDIFRACSMYWGTELKDLILSRDGVLVIRPDSGDVKRTLIEIFNILFDKFGYTVNAKGFKVLPPQVRVIQGDSVNYESIKEIYQTLTNNHIAAENLVLGMGGKLLQANIDRDTQNFAVKACYAVIDGKEVEIVKSPKEMDKDGNIHVSFKKSKKGLMKLVKNNGKYETIMKNENPLTFNEINDELVVVFENGKLITEHRFEDIRVRANNNIK